MKEEENKNVAVTETVNNNNQEAIMTDKETRTITTNTINKEDTMSETNQEATTSNTTLSIDELTKIHAEIKKDYAGLSANEKSSAAKSYNMGRNLSLLHKDNLYQQLSNHRGNPFKYWGDFCEIGCEFSRAYADKLMKSVAIQDALEQAGVTTIKQSVANLYSLHNAKKNDPELNLAEVWKKATGNVKNAFPSRKKVQDAINLKSNAPRKSSQVKKSSNTHLDLTSLLTAIKGIKLSEEDVQKVRQALDELLNSETADDSSEQAGQEDTPDTTLEAEPVKISA